MSPRNGQKVYLCCSKLNLMKTIYQLFLISTLMVAGCGQPASQGSDNGNDDGVEGNPNQALYDQVMDIHDEVMPKMEDLYKIKSQLQEKIANSPNMVKERKEALEKMILELDEASNAMMDWMHQFNPLPDSADEEDSRAYLETQMEKIKKVKEEMLTTLERAKGESAKN